METTQAVLFSPVLFYRAMPTTGGIGAPLAYGVIVGYVGLVASALYNATFQMVAGSSLHGLRDPRLERILPLLEGGMGLVGQVVLGPVFVVIGIVIGAAIVHLALMILGGANRGFEATFRVISYGEAAALFNLVPFCGGLVSAVYMVVLWVLGLSEAHGITRGLATAAVLLPLLLLCCCCGGLLGVAVGGIASLAGAMR